jgi:hypothetical protein
MNIQQRQATMEEIDRVLELPRPKIVCLCGSTRFFREFTEANCRETLGGKIVLSVGCFIHAVSEAYGFELALTAEQKLALDELHLCKIEIADEVLVLNVRGYVGESTRQEVRHAYAVGKPVRWLEPDKVPDDLREATQDSARNTAKG